MNRKEHTELGWLALFTSTGTLICCALPILLVTLGFGAVVASLTSQFPLLITLSEYDGWMFGISAGFLGLTAWLIWGREDRCPADPVNAERCRRSRRWNRRVFWSAAAIWAIGFTAAFLLLPLRNALGI
jgi:mercuric ion transport protein